MKSFGYTNLIQRDGGPEFGKVWYEEASEYCTTIRTSRPYKKNEQAYIESFNRTLRKECVGWMKYRRKDRSLLQEKVNKFLEYYNNVRPHLSLNLETPRAYLSHLR